MKEDSEGAPGPSYDWSHDGLVMFLPKPQNGGRSCIHPPGSCVHPPWEGMFAFSAVWI